MKILSRLTKITLISSAVLCLLAGTGFAQEPQLDANYAPDLNIYEGEGADSCDPDLLQIRAVVNNIEVGGTLVVELYGDDADNFLSSRGRLRRIRVPATAGPMPICITIERTGTYALASFHDQDADRKLDRKWNFLPKEPFALSLNRRLKLRKPRLEEAAIDVGEDGIDLELNLRTGRG